MKLTKERRVYAAILGLAGAAWIGDRVLFSGGPQHASAGQAVAVQAAAPSPDLSIKAPPSVASSKVDPGAAPVVPLAKRLETLRSSDPGPTDDAFAVPDNWRPKAAAAKAEAAAPARFDVEAFKKAHRLTTVLYGTKGGFAVIDGGTLRRPGQELDGITLREVTRDTAVFERDGVLVELRIQREGGVDGKVGVASENSDSGGAPR